METQKLVHGVGIGSVDVYLCKHGEASAVLLLCKLLNLLVGARLLVAELVAGESEDLKAFA